MSNSPSDQRPQQSLHPAAGARAIGGFEVGVILLISLGIGFASSHIAPSTEGPPILLELTESHPRDPVDLPAPRIEAHATARREGASDGRTEHWSRHPFELPQAGRFSVFGITSQAGAAPISLRIDGRVVAQHAFWRDTGSQRRHFERHRIAAGVALAAGAHTITLRGEKLAGRTLLLELRSERATPLRTAGVALGVALLLFARRRLLRERSWPPGVAVALSLGIAVALPAALIALASVRSGEDLAALGDPAPGQSERLLSFERESADPATRAACATRTCVLVLGDSTQFWGLAPDERMLPRLREALGDDYFVWGVSAAGLSAYDYYFLSQRGLALGADLLVLPLSLRSLSAWWLEGEGLRQPGVEAGLALRELPRALSLALADRHFDVSHWLLRRADAVLFGGAAERVGRGLRVLARGERDRIESDLTRAQPFAPAAPERPPAPLPKWPPPLPEDHEAFEILRAIGTMAARHDTALLYYTVNVNERAQERAGHAIRAAAQYAVIQRAVRGPANVFVLDLARENPEPMFRDPLDHLTPDGMQRVSGALAAEIRRLHASGALPR